MPTVLITIATQEGPCQIEAWVPGPRSPLALHRELIAFEDATMKGNYTITHRATGCSLNGLLRNHVLDRWSVVFMQGVLKTLNAVGAPLWAELDELDHATTQAPKDVIATHRDTYDAMKSALGDISRRNLRL